MDESMVSGNYFGRDYSSDQEESSWTVYIDDFEEGKFDDHDSISLSDDDESSTSMVSDGGSSLAVPLTKKKQIVDGNLCLNNLSSGTKSLKRRRSSDQYSSIDPDLEDTATSPSQSLKVIDLNQFIYNSTEEMSDIGNFQVQEYNLFKFPKKENNMKSLQKSLSLSPQEILNYYTNELRRKGLSLVPLSLLFNSTTTAAS